VSSESLDSSSQICLARIKASELLAGRLAAPTWLPLEREKVFGGLGDRDYPGGWGEVPAPAGDDVDHRRGVGQGSIKK
jgi:hypothetical protein